MENKFTPQQKKDIQTMIDKSLKDFQNTYISSKSTILGDTPTDNQQLVPKKYLISYVAAAIAAITGLYLPLAGGKMNDGANIAVGSTAGTKIATAPTQKLGFWGQTPIIQQTVTGSQAGNIALAGLLKALNNEGLIVDSTTP